MAKNDNLKDFLTDVADAIREKKGTTDLINPQDFSAEIASIQSGGGGIDTDKYLTIKALEDGLTAKITKVALEYYIESNGEWVNLPANSYTPAINKGERISFKGSHNIVGDAIGTFTITKKCELHGNAMSLIRGDDDTLDEALADLGFKELFKSCNTIIRVSENLLPAKTLRNNCYYSIFEGCTLLENAPNFPALTLTGSCYYSAFKGCTSLKTAPKIDATKLASACCVSMFEGCTNLRYPPQILAATSGDLTCYMRMFYRCSSLLVAPIINLTSVRTSSCNMMFYECESLEYAPELKAVSLSQWCYANMFYGCTNLKYIKADFKNAITDGTYTENWVSGIAQNGIFIKSANNAGIIEGDSGIPNGWNVITI